MPKGRSSGQGDRLRAAGLITITAATFLMLAWAIFPTVAGATHENAPFGSPSNPVESVTLCHAGSEVNPNFTSITPNVSSNGGNLNLAGHQNHSNDIIPSFYWDSNGDGDAMDAGELYGGQNWDAEGQAIFHNGCNAVTTTASTTASTTPPTTTATTTAPTTTAPTTTAPPPTTVSPTTITPTQEPPTQEPPGTTVGPTTVQPPGGTAFTGPESVIPLGVIALTLMTAGSGLLWAGTRRGRRK